MKKSQNKERKVKNRKLKEVARNGTKFRNASVTMERPDMSRFENRILCGDSKHLLKKLPANSIDLILTSPPYNFGLDYDNDADDASEWGAYFANLKNIWNECYRILVPGGRLVVNVQPLFSDYIPTHHVMSNQLKEIGFLWKGEILWEKNNYNCKYTAWGSWASPSMPYLKYTWEFIEVFTKISHKKTGDKSNIDITTEEFKNWVVAKWVMAPERGMKQYNHPAMFPEELANRVLKLFSYQDDLVLDPFNGAGTATLVAFKTNRRYIGMDISKEYCATARKRIRVAVKNSHAS